MNNKDLFEKIITEKRAKSSNERPKYGLRKLTVGVVSCLLGYMMFMTPNVTLAEKVEATPQAVEAKVESTETKKAEEVEQPKEEAIDKSSSVAKQPAVQPRAAVATESKAKEAETDKSTEFKLTDEQKKQLVDAGLTDGEIEFVTNEIKSELATDKDFKVDEYLVKVIELKKSRQRNWN
ncbi:YSIRK-type signal peptide-containing protein [Finegoldia magna]|uniref:YSIRK-type signal peptide-containing protein n=1 Tax=Finegoldia magna TaxID=1260 RepID=UPI0012B0E008|nr:YSIRK-type signal peptide-containing protein [Finegoldia magna]MSB17054.1 YSIRK-type signal peptide-containing protein [Finegoldia magna]MSD45859.1 YSIRK-type signal peptide-containing protein [Finegoldia magna]